ncbi:MAG TPA: PSD1 and planctomycete cytochrome C domain-containing protein [Chthoniobacter sp.]|nr:PSD1 and planctomycete cytochrome C domain-containing protein [Chthoniobacter sp.]
MIPRTIFHPGGLDGRPTVSRSGALALLWLSLLAATATGVAALTPDPAAQPTPDQLAFFEKNIRPVLADKCYKCHSAQSEKVKGGLLLDTREGIRMGGDNGHAVVPGNLKESLLVTALHWKDKDMQMPPEKDGGKLPDNVIADFEKWILMGAPDPRDGEAKVAKKVLDPKEAKATLWAFHAPKAAAAPAVKDSAWPRTEVDKFILAAQEAQGLHPVADADRLSLVRRVYFDLIGLPPTPQQVEAFLQDKSPDAYARLVDALLAAPQFGERWGRHWLDVARFAESTGKERNFTFPEAWRYRDWVIAAVNADVPYDAFVRQQVAGDLLPAKDGMEHAAHLTATGFLALGPKSLQEKNAEQFEMDLVDEQIDTTSRAVLGLTVACARCHDHKFDPVPQKEYYAMAGIFRSTQTYYGTGGTGVKNRNASALIPLPPATEQLVADSAAPAVPVAMPNRKENSKKKKKKGGPAPTAAVTVATGGAVMGVQDGRTTNSRLLVRGEVAQPGEMVPRGMLTVLSTDDAPKITSNGSGRLELAQWLTSSANPLTARVEVNRIWSYLFGQGLVRTGDNFGATGEKPSNPELLDALAVQFMRDGWSVKKMVRSLVMSHTYQLSSAHDSAENEKDTDNRLLWRASPRRLDAEAIRDALLTASGQLQVQPPRGSAVANAGAGFVGKGLSPERFSQVTANYRSVYLPVVRDFVPEVLDIFDFAEPSLVVASRDVTNVPVQALYLLNNGFVRDQANAMAKRILAQPLPHEQRITLAYEYALGRPPSAAEQKRAQQYLLSEGRALLPVKAGKVDDAALLSWSTFCQALFACAEFRYLK